ncbi:NAD(+)/NADH kinase [Rubrobacter indicoceani]|uniref:NAD(+)/NADH kinase n=1 Tax=Rubrobacter indicoceani TaxID=2051957 RepID=UPI0013C446D5|nr:NAD(+)/NADH kinase [Rubrobacter indicoceani]
MGSSGRVFVERAGVYVSPKVGGEHVERLVGALRSGGIVISEVRMDGEPDGGSSPDVVFVLGGDGTMLRASREYPGSVLLGVNFGRVGFMSGVQPEEIESGVEKVLANGLDVQEYRKLDVQVADGEWKTAANEAALLKRQTHHIVSVSVAISGESLFDFRCDGFIAATPLGSTAYALSAGGPILASDTLSYVLVPIAPHALVSRPLVLGQSQVTELTLKERAAVLSIDGGEPVELTAGDVVRVRISAESVRIGRTEEWTWWRAVRKTFL